MKVAIAGFGVEGKTSYDYWKARGDDVVIVDEQTVSDTPVEASVIVGEGAFSQLEGYDLVVRTAGLSPDKIRTSGKIWSASNEFFARCPAPIVGVTGTKGKGTTASLTASMLRAAGKTVHLVGNIGVPALEELPGISSDDIVIYELSSFQLWDLERSPHVAVVLMIEPDHLDVHSGMDDYVSAKANIRTHQTGDDVCIVHPTNELSNSIATSVSGDGHGSIIHFGVPDDGGVYVRENTFFAQNNAICSVDALQIAGAHNVENACAALTATRVFTDDTSAMEQGLRDFTGLDHRLKLVKVIANVSYYDDSIATTPGSAIAALRSFEAPKVLILGGSDKGADYTELIELCVTTKTRVIAIGTVGAAIATLCRQYGVDVVELGFASMDEIVGQAQKIADPDSVVILSPAAASFDMFKNYTDRGEQFVAAVERLS